MHKSTIFLALLLGLSACKTNQPQPTPTENKNCFSKEWNYAKYELKTKDQPCETHKILFTNEIAHSDGRDFLVKAADIVDIAMGEGPQFKINDEPYTGMLIGVIEREGKEDTLLECNFKRGMLTGTAFVRRSDGVLVTTFPREPRPIDPPIIVPVNPPDVVKKPVIYLYPTAEQRVNVQVDFEGKLTHTYPKYNPEKGWTVLAKPDGELLDEASGKRYYSLFWEGESRYRYAIEEGFVVEGSRSAQFLDESLEKLGLNRREANEFITFWLPELEKNPYNLIHFSTTEYQKQAQLQITPKPDTEIRVFMVFEPLQTPIDIAPQTLKTTKRKGFTAVEWGGKSQTHLAH